MKNHHHIRAYSEMVVIFLQNSVTMQKKDKDKGRYTYQ